MKRNNAGKCTKHYLTIESGYVKTKTKIGFFFGLNLEVTSINTICFVQNYYTRNVSTCNPTQEFDNVESSRQTDNWHTQNRTFFVKGIT